MKRYLVFFGETHYPLGGMDDFNGDFDSLDEAIAHIENLRKTSFEEVEDWGVIAWGHIYDIETRSCAWTSNEFED